MKSQNVFGRKKYNNVHTGNKQKESGLQSPPCQASSRDAIKKKRSTLTNDRRKVKGSKFLSPVGTLTRTVHV